MRWFLGILLAFSLVSASHSQNSIPKGIKASGPHGDEYGGHHKHQ